MSYFNQLNIAEEQKIECPPELLEIDVDKLLEQNSYKTNKSITARMMTAAENEKYRHLIDRSQRESDHFHDFDIMK